MANDNKDNNDNKQSYGIAAALSEALEAAVFADSTASNKAYEMIEKYAYGEDFVAQADEDDVASMNNAESNEAVTVGSTELAMVQFSMRDSSGLVREFSIPKITMMPLPLLHVTEADFEIEMKASVVSTNTTEESTMKSDETKGKRPETNPSAGKRPAASSRVLRRTADGRLVRLSASARQVATETTAAMGMTSSVAATTNQQMVVSNKDTASDSSASTINMKVKIKMQQAELPEGIKLMLQAAANSLQVSSNMPIGGDY